jgi:hypothetical protein
MSEQSDSSDDADVGSEKPVALSESDEEASFERDLAQRPRSSQRAPRSRAATNESRESDVRCAFALLHCTVTRLSTQYTYAVQDTCTTRSTHSTRFPLRITVQYLCAKHVGCAQRVSSTEKDTTGPQEAEVSPRAVVCLPEPYAICVVAGGDERHQSCRSPTARDSAASRPSSEGNVE